MKKFAFFITLAIFSLPVFVFILIPVEGAAQTGNTVTVNPAIRYQTITGWEATAQAGQDSSAAFPNYKNTLFDSAVNDLGINRVRLEIKSGAENTRDTYVEYKSGLIDYAAYRCLRYSTVNDNSDPNTINSNGFHYTDFDLAIDQVVVPLRQRLQARGEQLYVNFNYVAFTGQMTAAGCPAGLQYIHTDPQEYAEFILATFQHIKNKYGWVPDAVEIILEPDNTSFWRGTQIGNAIVATANKLSANGFNPDFIAPSNTSMSNAITYFDAMVQVPGVLQRLKEFSYHLYSGVSDTNRQSIGNRAVQYGINTSQLEKIGSDYFDLHKDLKLARVSSWSQFTLGSPGTDNGAHYYWINDSNPSSPIINIGGRTKFLRQYFKFIRRGAVRIDASSGNASFDPLAFINTDGKYVVVVSASSGGSFAVQGLPAGTYGIKYTAGGANSPAYYDVDLTDATISIGQAVNASIPIAGVVTIYAKSGGTPLPPPPPSDTTAPSVPTGLTATAVSSSQINLSWNASTDNVGVTGYRVYRGGTQIATITGTSYQNTGLTAATTYSYTVAAYDAAGNVSAQSSSVSATTPR